MAIVLFALIGAKLQMGAVFWVCFALYCAIRLCKAVLETKE